MKRLLTLHSWKIFFITAGLPVLSFVLGIVCIIVVLFLAGSEPSLGEDIATVLVFTGLGIGLVIFQLWAVTLGHCLLQIKEDKTWLKWLFWAAGLCGAVILVIVIWQLLDYSLNMPPIKVSESIGVNAVQPPPRNWLLMVLTLSIWFIPRFLLYGMLARLLVRVEGHSRWLTTFILFILWPIGIWFLQSSIRNIFRAPEERNIAEHLI